MNLWDFMNHWTPDRHRILSGMITSVKVWLTLNKANLKVYPWRMSRPARTFNARLPPRIPGPARGRSGTATRGRGPRGAGAPAATSQQEAATFEKWRAARLLLHSLEIPVREKEFHLTSWIQSYIPPLDFFLNDFLNFSSNKLTTPRRTVGKQLKKESCRWPH